jgi:hypothetical protein
MKYLLQVGDHWVCFDNHRFALTMNAATAGSLTEYEVLNYLNLYYFGRSGSIVRIIPDAK